MNLGGGIQRRVALGATVLLLGGLMHVVHAEEGRWRLDASGHVNYWFMKDVPNTTHRSEPFTSAELALTLPWNNIMGSIERTNTPVTDKLGQTDMEKLFLWLPVLHRPGYDLGFFSGQQTYRSTLTVEASTTQIFPDFSFTTLNPGSQLNEPVTFKESGLFWSGRIPLKRPATGAASWRVWLSAKDYTRPYGVNGFIGEVRFTSNVLGLEVGMARPEGNGWYGNASLGLGFNSKMHIGSLSVATNMAPGRYLQYSELGAQLYYRWHMNDCLWAGSLCGADIGGSYKYSDYSVRGNDPNNPNTTQFYGTLTRDQFFDLSAQLTVAF